MPRKLDIGLASYGSPDLLQQSLFSIAHYSQTDWRLIVINNHHPDSTVQQQVEEILSNFRAGYGSAKVKIIHPSTDSGNVGYAGAVELIQKFAETEYIGYIDNDAKPQSYGWDETLCSYLDRFHEIGMIFPGGGPYQIDRGAYTEVMWGVGFCWVLSRLCQSEVGVFDSSIGHQNEADYALRVRMAGWKCACAPEVTIKHLAKASTSQDPAAIERISKGVREFVDKWCRYFGGKNINYHSTNVLRWEDWPPNALYLEEYWKQKGELSGLNVSPEIVRLDGREYDLIKVPRLSGFYRGRIV